MTSNSRQKSFSSTVKSSKKLSYQQYITSNYLDPDLYRLMEFELQSPPSPSKNGLLYLVCALASLTLVGLGLGVQFTEIKQAFRDFHNAVADDYSALIHH